MRSPLLAFLLRHCLVGIAAGWLLLAGLLASDAMGLRSLIFASDFWLEAMVLLLVFFAITFGSLAMGTGVMLLPGEETKPPGPTGRWRALQPVPQRAPGKPRAG